MSKWDDIKKSVGSYAEKTKTKTRELTDSASLNIKIASKEADRDAEYKTLGRLMYKKLKGKNIKDPEALTREISETMARLDEIISELSSLKKEKQKRQDAREAEKAAKAAAKEKQRNSDEGQDRDDKSEN